MSRKKIIGYVVRMAGETWSVTTELGKTPNEPYPVLWRGDGFELFKSRKAAQRAIQATEKYADQNKYPWGPFAIERIYAAKATP